MQAGGRSRAVALLRPVDEGGHALLVNSSGFGVSPFSHELQINGGDALTAESTLCDATEKHREVLKKKKNRKPLLPCTELTLANVKTGENAQEDKILGDSPEHKTSTRDSSQ